MYQPPKWPYSYFLKALEFYLTVLFSWISKNVFYLESLWFSTTRKIKFSIKDFFSKCDQIRWKLRIWSHLLKKYLIENFIFCAVKHYRQSQFLLGNSQIAMNLNETPIKYWKHVKTKIERKCDVWKNLWTCLKHLLYF